jgi:hypothetical protein
LPENNLMETMSAISWGDFEKIEMRVGTIIEAEVFQEAKKAGL